MAEAVAERYWREFESEASEHLASVEACLMGFVEDRVADNVAPLFRALHSMKGLARAMGLSGMEQVAHLAESVLHFVRENHAAASPEIVEALFLAQDALSRQLSAAVLSRRDHPAEATLVRTLDSQQKRLAGQACGDAASEAGADGTVERDEAEEMLQLFGELLQVNLEVIAGVFAATTPAERGPVLDALAETVNAAEVLQLGAFRDNLVAIAEIVGEGAFHEPGPSRAALVRGLAELVLNAQVVEGASGAAASLTATAAVALEKDVRVALASLRRDAEGLARAPEGAPGLAARAGFARDLMLCIGAAGACDLLVLFQEACLHLGTQPDEGTAREATIIADVARRLAEAEDLAGETFAAQGAELRGVLAGEAPVPSRDVAGIDVGADMRDHLDGPGTERLRERLQAGDTAYRWSLFLEDARSTASTVIEWISKEAHAIHSLTRIREGKSWFEVLLATPVRAGEMPALVARLDPDGLCIKRVIALDATPQGVTIADEADAGSAPAEQEEAVPLQAAEARYFRVRSEAVDGLIGALGTLRGRLSDLAEIVAWQRRTVTPREPSMLLSADAARDDDAADRGAAMLASLEQLAERIEADAYTLQLVPLEQTFRRLPRIVHALAQQQGKLVRLEMDHGGVRVDKAIIELLFEPLVHLITNAVDHGIETPESRTAAGKPPSATVTVQAGRVGGELVLTVGDDGRGMDEHAIRRAALARGLVEDEALARLRSKDIFRLTLQPGFSTATQLTKTSGRGVGLDVVATTLQCLGGSIDIDSAAAVGTSFRLRLPLSRSLQSLVLAEADGQVYAFNERSVVRLALADTERGIDGVGSFESATDGTVKVLALTRLLQRPEVTEAPVGEQPLVLVGDGHETLGIQVTRILGRRSMALQPNNPYLSAAGVVAGATILVNGDVVLLLDARELLAIAREGRWRQAPLPA